MVIYVKLRVRLFVVSNIDLQTTRISHRLCFVLWIVGLKFAYFQMTLGHVVDWKSIFLGRLSVQIRIR